MIGAWQIALLLVFLLIFSIVVFFMGYLIGKKSGYLKGVKETESH